MGRSKRNRKKRKKNRPDREKELEKSAAEAAPEVEPPALQADFEKVGRWGIVLVFFIITALFGLFKVYNLDVGVHLRTGEVIWKDEARKPEFGAKHRIPRKNIYTYSRASYIITLQKDLDLANLVRLRRGEKLNGGRIITGGPGTVFRAFIAKEEPSGIVDRVFFSDEKVPDAVLDKERVTLHVDTVWPSPRIGERPIDDFAKLNLPVKDIEAMELADWTDHEWLFQVVIYLINDIMGPHGLVLLRIALLIGVFVLLFKMASRWAHYLIIVYVSLVVIIASNLRFFMRPEIFSLLFTVYTLFCLDQFKYGSRKWVYSLPPLILVWTNMHGFFAVGIALVAFFLLGELFEWFMAKYVPMLRAKDNSPLDKRGYVILLIILVAMFACSFVNPYGVEGALFPYKQLGFAKVFHEKISELKSPFSIKTHVIVKGLLFFKILLFAGIPILLLGIRHVRMFWLVVFGIAAWQAAKSNRNIGLFALGAHVPLCISIQAILRFAAEYRKNFDWQKVRIAAGAVFIVIFVWLFWALSTSNFYVSERNTKRFGFGWSEFAYPVKAATWVKEDMKIPGIMFNNFDTGNYLIYRFFPWKRTFIDGRTEVYGHHYYGDVYYNVMAPNPRIPDKGKYLNRYFDRLKIAFVLVKHSSNDIGNLPERLYAGYRLATDPSGRAVINPETNQPIYIPDPNSKWALVYLDETACVFVRRNVEILDYLSQKEKQHLRWLAQKFELTPIRLKQEILKNTFKDVSEASRPFFHYNRGRFLKAVRQHDIALIEFENAVKLREDIEDFHNGYAAALYLVNILHMDRIRKALKRESDQAKEKYGPDQKKWPRDVIKRYKNLQQMLGQALDKKSGYLFRGVNNKQYQTLKLCFEHMREAVRLNPGYFEAWKNMKIMYWQLGEFEEALRCLEMYIKILGIKAGHPEFKRCGKERQDLIRMINERFSTRPGIMPRSFRPGDLLIGGPRFRGDSGKRRR